MDGDGGVVGAKVGVAFDFPMDNGDERGADGLASA